MCDKIFSVVVLSTLSRPTAGAELQKSPRDGKYTMIQFNCPNVCYAVW